MSVAALEHVTKSFGAVRALDGASFTIREGEVVALLGPNGAGKSTAIAVLLGLRRPDAGTARLFGQDPRAPASRRLVGATPQESAFPPTLLVREVVDLVRAHFERPPPAAEIHERFQLGPIADRQFGGLSGGQRRRVGVALAFAGAPRLVVLDEPTTGLDREARAAVWDAVRAHGRSGGSALLTTHHLEEADALAGRVVLIDGGAVVADGPVSEVKAGAGLTVVRLRALQGVEIEGAEPDGDFVRLLVPDGGAAVRRLVQEGVPLVDLEVRPLTLEEALAAPGSSQVRLALVHARAMTLELLRYPAYLVPTLFLPSVFFLFFVSPGSQPDAASRMATFAGFAVIGVAFFQFGVGIAADRASPWEVFLRTLPLGAAIRLGARLLSASIFAVASAALLVVTAVATTDVALPATAWVELPIALLLGTIPFALLGIALGYWAPAKAALPLANLLYLVLAYAGGLWMLPSELPSAVRPISPFLPTRAFADELAATVRGTPLDWGAWLALAGFAVLFALAATVGYRRDEGRRFA